MTLYWVRWHLKSPAPRLFTQTFIRAQIKDNSKVPRHWPLCGDFTYDPWIPRTNGQWRGKCFHLIMSSLYWRGRAVWHSVPYASPRQNIMAFCVWPLRHGIECTHCSSALISFTSLIRLSPMFCSNVVTSKIYQIIWKPIVSHWLFVPVYSLITNWCIV